MLKAARDKALALIKQEGVIRPRDLEAKGIPRQYLWWLWQEGLVDRVGRGLYTLKGAETTELQTMAEASKRIPQGVICLLSALQFHGLTTATPFQIWMAIAVKARRPKVDRPVMKFVRFSGRALTSGIEEHRQGRVTIKVYNSAKTVADCFKYRHKIGLDVALAALRDCRQQKQCSADDLWRYAKICRVQNVMKPYLEAVT